MGAQMIRRAPESRRRGGRFARRSVAALAAGVVLLLAGAQPSRAQEVEVRVGRGPHYAGIPVDLQVLLHADHEFEPACKGTAPPGTTLTQQGAPGRKVSQQISIRNGRRVVVMDLTYVYGFSFIAAAPGTYEIPPFEATIDGVAYRTRPVRLTLIEVPVTDLMKVRVRLPERALVLGQRVSATVEWWIADELVESVQERGYTIVVPLFDRIDLFDFDDPDEQVRSRNQLRVETAAGPLRLASNQERRREGGRDGVVLRAQRTVIPKVSGQHVIAPAVVSVEQVTRWRRDRFFGTKRALEVRRVKCEDLARTVVVGELPPDAPESFAGAVGKGFTIEVSADRTVVQAGDPIRLTIELRGDGNLEALSLPPLSADGGLPPQRFRLPAGDVTGRMVDGAKVFEVGVRPLDDGIDALPPIAFSWYDPDLSRYETTRSRPIALSVRKADVIGAQDVVGGAPESSAQEGVPTGAGAGAESPSGARPVFTLTGADLSVPASADALLSNGGDLTGGAAALGLLYGVPCIAIAVSLWGRRRAAIDPRVLARRRRLDEEARAIQRAHTGGVEELREVVAGLRRMAAELQDGARASGTPAELAPFLAECETVIYAPDGREMEALDEDRLRRARELAAALREAGR